MSVRYYATCAAVAAACAMFGQNASADTLSPSMVKWTYMGGGSIMEGGSYAVLSDPDGGPMSYYGTEMQTWGYTWAKFETPESRQGYTIKATLHVTVTGILMMPPPGQVGGMQVAVYGVHDDVAKIGGDYTMEDFVNQIALDQAVDAQWVEPGATTSGGAYATLTNPVTVTLDISDVVNGWTLENNGLVLGFDETTGSKGARIAISGENGLSISYEYVAVPEATSLSMLAAGGLMLLSRSRKRG